MTRQVYEDLKSDPRIARSRSGESLASLEIVGVVLLASVDTRIRRRQVSV